MIYTYVLKSLKDNRWYTGLTCNLKRRIKKHNNGEIQSTKNRKPFRIIYYEACLNEHDARTREKYLKTAWGKRYLKNCVKNYLTGNIP